MMAACTSRAAASMLRLRSNCSTMVVAPSRLLDVISVTPAIRPNCRSSGVATDDAMFSGLAPGSSARTWITGNSTCGSDATGSVRYATTPASSNAMLNNDVAIGRRMNGSLMFTTDHSNDAASVGARFRRNRRWLTRAAKSPRETIEVEVDDGRRVEREELGEDQA